MGVDTEGCTEEEDVSHEEATQANGWERVEGCHSIEQMLGLWARQESTSPMSILCARYDIDWEFVTIFS